MARTFKIAAALYAPDFQNSRRALCATVKHLSSLTLRLLNALGHVVVLL
jgi:hypothetical protein